ncbi:MAG TPA: LCP family protein [Candidatus Limnocylindria bacterium]
MTGRNRRQSHANETPRARRIREAEAREHALRARGIDPYARARAELEAGPPAVRVRGPRRLRRRLLTALIIVLVVSGFGGVLLWQRIAAFNDAVSSASSASSALFFPLMGSDRVNVVVYGYGGEEHGGGIYLADSINILSIDPSTDTTTIIPIPRDLWITGQPELPRNGKVNEAFAVGYQNGGIQEAGNLATALLASVTGLTIEHWIALDFAGFREMVDTIGGVTVNNPTPFGYTWSEDRYHAGDFNAGSFAAGEIFLSGDDALSYSRTRYTSVPAESSDFARSIRQQRVLAALRTKLGGGGLGSLGPGLALMDALKGRMGTDLSAIDLFLLSGHLGVDRRIELREDVILEATINEIGQYVLVVIGRTSASDYSPLHAFLAEGLAAPIAAPVSSASSAP